MTQILNLDDFRPKAVARIVVAVDDALYLFLHEKSFVCGEHAVEYVPASSLEDPNTEADLWIGRYTPSAPGRRLFFQTVSGAVYEFDERGLIYRSGELVWSEPIADFGIAATNERGVLRIGHEAALLFLGPVDDGWHVRVRVTTPVLLVAHLPRLHWRSPIPRGWLALAARRRHGAAG